MSSPPGLLKGSKGQRARNRAAQRERLYRAALALFRKRGFDSTTIDDIVHRAGAARGTFFNYFLGKQHVLIEYQRRMGAEIMAALAPRTYDSALDAVQDGLRECAIRAKDDPVMGRLILRTILASDELLSADEDNEAMLSEWLAAHVREGVRRGELSRSLDVRLFVSLLIGTLSSTVIERVTGSRVFDLEDVLRRKVSLLFTGVLRQPSTRKHAR